MWDGSSEVAKAEWQSKIDGADVLIMDELAIGYLGRKIDGKRIIALQHDAAASMRTCDKGVCVFVCHSCHTMRQQPCEKGVRVVAGKLPPAALLARTGLMRNCPARVDALPCSGHHLRLLLAKWTTAPRGSARATKLYTKKS